MGTCPDLIKDSMTQCVWQKRIDTHARKKSSQIPPSKKTTGFTFAHKERERERETARACACGGSGGETPTSRQNLATSPGKPERAAREFTGNRRKAEERCRLRQTIAPPLTASLPPSFLVLNMAAMSTLPTNVLQPAN